MIFLEHIEITVTLSKEINSLDSIGVEFTADYMPNLRDLGLVVIKRTRLS